MRAVHVGIAFTLVAAAAGAWLWLGRGAGGSGTTEAARPDEAAPAPGTGVTLEGAGRAGEGGARAKAPPAPPGTSDEGGDTPSVERVLVITLRAPDDKPLTVRASVVVRDAAGRTFKAEVEPGAAARFTAPALGKATIEVSAPDLLQDHDQWIDVEEGENATDVTLERGIAVDGRILDAQSGQPVAGAEVDVRGGGELDDGSASGGRPSYGKVKSDAEGRFRTPGLPIDFIVTLKAVAQGYGQLEKALSLALLDGERPVLVLRMEPGGWVRGRVTNASGEPVAGATVHALRKSDPRLQADFTEFDPTDGSIPDGLLTTLTDAEGRYLLLGLSLAEEWCATAVAPGHARSEDVCGLVASPGGLEARADLVVRRPGRLTVRLEGADDLGRAGEVLDDVTWGARKATAGGANVARFEGVSPGRRPLHVDVRGFLVLTAEVEVRDGEEIERTFRLVPGLAIEGVLLDEVGTACRDSYVFCSVVEGEYRHVSTNTDREGRFRLAGLRPEPHEVKAYVGASAATLATVTPPATGLRLTLPSERKVKARFRVPDGAAPPTKYIAWAIQEDGSGSGGHGTWTDGNVEWRIGPGKHKLAFVCEELAVWEQKDVEVAAGRTLDLGEILLDVGVEIAGRVLDPEGRPITVPGHVTSHGREGNTQLGADGTFRLLHMPRGPVTVYVRAEGFLPQELSRDTREESGRVEIRLSRGGLLVGSVAAATGPLPEGLHVTVSDTSAPEYEFNRWDYQDLDDRGAFKSRLLPGTYKVEVRKSEEAVLATAEVTLVEGKETPLKITLPAR